ncbi:HypC/HybG/HupF family hydrogenase formation chaperone [Oceanospirillum sediminis]|uniref:HypC/HybG/HupF family hydrogenase formation chaperone n=1 Tax=Oceanospirillum sediminis TaxID=2760088 RepID=A0A839IUR2_9GAMM|nr:HypC/HybG/HupF family hydrogenase formation chaperone [Oceanospirillum sediminis]MBB1488691.1 HypC/HybG/HupF family hydrogenase formation chaperone [Oceanospirillum sediminis]
MCLGIPGQVVAITDEAAQLASVDVCGVKRQVNYACVLTEGENAESLLGAWVLVHVGFAMSRIDEEEAQNTLALLSQLDELNEEMDAIRASVEDSAS